MAITIFLADDHAVMREGLMHVLHQHQDLRVVGAAGEGREAVREIARLKPEVAIIDIGMPEMNGIEASRQLAERSPQTRILILSMHATPEHVFHALEAGVRGYLLKESAGGEIVTAVRTVHAGRRYLGRKIAEIVAEQVADPRRENPLERLSRREREILQLVADGCTSAQIAEKLHLSSSTVDTYRSRLMEKLGIGDIAGLVKFAIQQGLTTLD